MPDKRVLITFVPFAMLAAGFFASPPQFVLLLLPIGGLYYFFLAYVVGAAASILQLGPEYVSYGQGFLTLLAVTGAGYLYTLSCYISHISKRKNDGRRTLMIISIAGIFVSPIVLVYFPLLTYSPSQVLEAPITYLGEDTCRSLPLDEGVSYWDAKETRCTVSGVLGLPVNYRLGIRNDTILQISGTDSRFEYSGYYALLNDGTISLKDGATFINVRDHTDPSNPREAFFQNRGILVNDEKSMIINQARIDNFEAAGKIVNNGFFDNRGQIFSNNFIENNGLLMNNGYIASYNTDQLVALGKQVTIENHGTIRNLNTLSNSGGVFYNSGTIENYGDMNVGILHNYSILENETGDLTGEIIYSYCGAKMVPPSEDIQLDDLC